MKKILIINGHPDKDAFCTALAQRYCDGAHSSGASCQIIHLHELTFDPVLHFGYNHRTELEPDLLMAQQAIKDANHLVWVYPTWWGTYPALMKGFIDRVFLPKFAFKYRENSPLWDKLLKGKTAHLMVTMDTPPWYYRLVFGSPGHQSMKKGILGFCGIKTVKITTFSPLRGSSEAKRDAWLEKAERLGMSLV